MAELIVSCPNCSARYNVAKYESGTKFKCKSCGKFLIVPEKPQDEGEGPPILEPEPASRSKGSKGGGSRGGRGGARGRRGGTRTRVGASRGGSRSRDAEDDEYDDRQMPRVNRGPNWPLIIGAGVGVLVVLIGIVVAISSVLKREEENLRRMEAEERAERGKYKNELEGYEQKEGEEGEIKHRKFSDKPKKDKPKPGEHVGDGKIAELEDDKEATGEETKRTLWKQADIKDKAKRWKVRKKLIRVEGGAKSTGDSAMAKFKEVFGDPEAEREALAPLDGLGKDAIPVILNFMTKEINHMTEEGGMMGSSVFNYVRDLAIKHWKYENEFNYGMFESGEERWNAIIEMKMKCLEEGYDLEE